jgi:hypothetical protein
MRCIIRFPYGTYMSGHLEATWMSQQVLSQIARCGSSGPEGHFNKIPSTVRLNIYSPSATFLPRISMVYPKLDDGTSQKLFYLRIFFH